MASTPTSTELAHQIWPRLVVIAETRGSITRATLAARFGIKGQRLRNFDQILALLESYCRQHGLPPLHALIVHKEADVPGAHDPAALRDIEAVYGYNWRGRSPIIPSEAAFASALAHALATT